MSDLVEFLRKRLDEDECEIRLVLQPDEPDPQPLISHRAMHMVLTHELEADWPTGSPRMFADIKAKRRLLDLHEPAETEYVDGDVCMVCTAVGEGPHYPCQTLRLLTLPYAEHPDYRDEWKPTS